VSEKNNRQICFTSWNRLAQYISRGTYSASMAGAWGDRHQNGKRYVQDRHPSIISAKSIQEFRMSCVSSREIHRQTDRQTNTQTGKLNKLMSSSTTEEIIKCVLHSRHNRPSTIVNLPEVPSYMYLLMLFHCRAIHVCCRG